MPYDRYDCDQAIWDCASLLRLDDAMRLYAIIVYWRGFLYIAIVVIDHERSADFERHDPAEC